MEAKIANVRRRKLRKLAGFGIELHPEAVLFPPVIDFFERCAVFSHAFLGIVREFLRALFFEQIISLLPRKGLRVIAF